MKKTYEVELKRESYVTLFIEAENEDEAEAKAWAEIDSRPDMGYATWGIESIEEMKGD